MVQEDNTNWQTFFKTSPNPGNFESALPVTDGWPRPGSTFTGIYTPSVKLLGNQSVLFHHSGVYGGSAYGSYGSYPTSGCDGEYWMRYYGRWKVNAYQWPSNYMKVTMTGDPGDCGGGYQTYFDWAGNSGNYPTYYFYKVDTVQQYYAEIPSGQLQADKWYLFEYHWANKQGSDQHTIYEVWLDGVKVVDYTGPAGMYHPLLRMWFGIPNHMGVQGQPYDISNWTDGLVISHSRVYPASKIEVSNNATYGQGTTNYQEPILLADTSSQVKLNLTGLGAGPYYLWITNNKQERSTAYNLEGGADTTSPTVTSVSIGQNGTTLTVTFDELVTQGSGYANSNWDVDCGTAGSNLPVTYVSGNGSAVHIYTIGATVYANDVCNSDFNGTANSEEDASGNDLAAIVSMAISNGSTQTIGTSYNVLLQESFNDASFSARGWYDNTTHGTIVADGFAGNCLQWAWTATNTKPTNGDAMRHYITPTDNLYVSLYAKFESAWRGSQQTYHPHMLVFPSDLDTAYSSLANNYLNTYLEAVSDVGSPYVIRPATAIQDSLRVNSGLGTPPVDLTSTTETRSVTYCNGCKSGADCGTGVCYQDGSWYSSNIYREAGDVLPKNEWVKYEAYFKMNTITGEVGNADGIMRLWVNGVLVMDFTHVVYRTNQDATKKWAQVVLSPYIGDGSPITQTMWIDELIIGNNLPTGGISLGIIIGPGGGVINAGPGGGIINF